MTIISEITSPHAQVVDDGQSIRVHFNRRHSLIISTRDEAEQIRGLLTKALHYFDAAERYRESLLDREAMRDINFDSVSDHIDWGGSMAGFTKMPPRQPLDGAA
jgi:hypothetical protein